MNKFTFAFISIALLLSQSLTAQEDIIKIGIPQLTYKSINVGIEHPFGRSISLNLTANFQLPQSFESGFIGNQLNTIDQDAANIDFLPGREFQGVDFIPELRFYLKGGKSKKSHAPTGFYVSILGKYSSYRSMVPFHLRYGEDLVFTVEEETYTVTGRTVEVDVDSEFEAKALTGGIGLGGQWMLTKARNLTLGFDLGLGWGSSKINGNVVAIRESISISDPELQALLGQEEINSLIDSYTAELVDDFQADLDDSDTPFSKSLDIDLKADGNVLTVDGKTPWPLVRIGLTVGYAF